MAKVAPLHQGRVEGRAFYSHVSREVLLGARQTDDGHGMSWGGRCGVIHADLHRQKRQPCWVSERHKPGSQQSCYRKAWCSWKPRIMPSATHHGPYLWFVGRAGQEYIGLCPGEVGGWGGGLPRLHSKITQVRLRMKTSWIDGQQSTTRLLDPSLSAPPHPPPSARASLCLWKPALRIWYNG